MEGLGQLKIIHRIGILYHILADIFIQVQYNNMATARIICELNIVTKTIVIGLVIFG